DGKFSFENVTLPFDIYIKDSARQYEAIYKNINTNNLVFNIPLSFGESTGFYLTVNHLFFSPEN
ncbi:MAG: hypothetical protein QG646_2307, partial [Euryarchaeota archaeon]|nr:hypothetical protein [Euryarchaeota archaeon]